jgi:hypothetical protein
MPHWSKHQPCLALLLWAICFWNSAHCQSNSLPDAALGELQRDPAFKLWGENSELKKCGICHFSPGNEFAQRDTDFCALAEVKLWLQNDRHAISRQRVEPLSRAEVDQQQADNVGNWIGESNIVSFEMCRKLNYDLKTDVGYAKFRDNCLTCHAGYDSTKALNASVFSRTDTYQPGITCNYCHQAYDNNNTTWIDKHGGFSAKEEWRLLPPKQKEAAGMRNLLDVQTQAQLCAECHIGDLAAGKFVTHEMYVAGHPPLPSFELQTFVSKMPPHWRSPGATYKALEKYSERERYFSINLPAHNGSLPRNFDNSCWETRTMLLGAVKAAEQSTAMVAKSAATQIWGDYALYDCAACHHELRLPSARQQRQTAEVPGRPRLLEWPSVLLDVAIAIADTSGEVEQAKNDLHLAVNQTPFGDPQQCSGKAKALQNALKTVGENLCSVDIQPAMAKNVMKKLTQTSKDKLLDYHAARQVIWAIRVVDNELSVKNASLPAATRDAVAKLGQQDKQILVSASLPAGRNSSLYPKQTAPSEIGFLTDELERIRQYDAQAASLIHSQLRALGEQLD